MKSFIFKAVIAGLVLAFAGGITMLFTANPGIASDQTPVPQHTATPVNQKQQRALTVARGAREWASTCGSCHNLRNPKEYSDQQWKVIMLQMHARANLTDQQYRDILVFLQSSN